MRKINLVVLVLFLTFSQIFSITQAHSKSVLEANNRFAMHFYSEITKTKKGNLFFSPFSILYTFGMIYEGAYGKTAEEIMTVFCLPVDEKSRLNEFSSLYSSLNEKKDRCTLKLANALWIQKNFHLLKSYSEILEKYFRSESFNLDFVSMRDDAVTKINNWAKQKTEGKVRNLLDDNDISAQTRLVLTNAIYFKGFWKVPFDKNSTKPENFWVDKNTAVKVQMMQLSGREFLYAETDNFQIIKLPYQCQNLSMLVLLPKQNEPDIMNLINYEKLLEYKKLLTKQKVNIFLPKFRDESTIDLSETLKKLGIKQAFNPALADFLKMTGNKDLFISKAIQKSYIEVNEEGTEAAAATGIVMNITSVQPETIKIFRADHPFLFFIMEENYGLVLFIGKITNP